MRITAGHRSWRGGRKRAHGSVTSQLTPRLEAHGMIVGCSQALPASVDVLSPCILTRRGPESDLMVGHEMTPAGALKMNPPIPGGNRLKERSWRRYSRGFDPGRPPAAASPTRPPYWTPDAAAAKAAAGEPLAPSGHRGLKGTQPDCRQRSAGRPSQCACASGERVRLRHSGSHGCQGNHALRPGRQEPSVAVLGWRGSEAPA